MYGMAGRRIGLREKLRPRVPLLLKVEQARWRKQDPPRCKFDACVEKHMMCGFVSYCALSPGHFRTRSKITTNRRLCVLFDQTGDARSSYRNISRRPPTLRPPKLPQKYRRPDHRYCRRHTGLFRPTTRQQLSPTPMPETHLLGEVDLKGPGRLWVKKIPGKGKFAWNGSSDEKMQH